MYRSTIFQQLLNLLPRSGFERRVAERQLQRYVKHFTPWNQLQVNLYAQASGKKSLRDVETGLRVQYRAWYHLGLTQVARSTLAYANTHRDAALYEETFYLLLAQCKSVTPKHKFRFKNPLYALDATVIDLCLEAFPWAKFRTTKGALKIHTLLDYCGSLPSFLVITDAKHHEVTVAREQALPLFRDSIVVMDKAYLDFQWLYRLHQQPVWFVTRAKTNLDCQVLGQHSQPQKKGVIADEKIQLCGPLTATKFPAPLRRITFEDASTKKVLVFLTNNFHLAATTIAAIYKARWEIELFFKWIKQNLKITTFLGTSRNAVLTQIWTAMIYYLLLAYIKYQTKYGYSLLHFTRIIREALFTDADIIDLLNLSLPKLVKLREPCPQLTLW
jgi:hypothetical protein